MYTLGYNLWAILRYPRTTNKYIQYVLGIIHTAFDYGLLWSDFLYIFHGYFAGIG